MCLLRFLTAAAFTKDVVLILDDAQLLDRDSIALLGKLREVPGVLIVLGLRNDESTGDTGARLTSENVRL